MHIRTIPIILAAALIFLHAGASHAEKAAMIHAGEPLGLERCLTIARANAPVIMAAMGQAAASQGRVGQVRSLYYPAVDLSADYGINGSSTDFNGADPEDSYSASVTLSQNIYDFGRRSAQLKARNFDAGAFRAELRNTVSVTEFNTKQAYYRLLQAKGNVEVAAEVIKQFERQLERARGFLEVGLRPRFDVTRAEVDLSVAKVNLLRAQNAVRIAMAVLKNEMGVPEAPDFEVKDGLDSRKVEIKLDEAIKKALDNRSDLKASAARRKAVEESVTLAERGNYPFITGSAGYTWDGSSTRDDGWNASISVTMPVFDGFFTRYRVQESKANLTVMDASEALARQNVIFEVQQAWSNLVEAGERIPAAALALRQAEENLEIASGRYSTGVGSPIEVTDAALVFINARTAHIQALTDYRIAEASLERATGQAGADGE